MSELIESVLRTNIYIQPFCLFLSILTNVLNIRVLQCRSLRSSSCTYYFLAYGFFSIVYMCLICPTQFLRALSINWADGRITCKISSYILFLFPFQANLMLVFASVDRYCSTTLTYYIHSKAMIRTARFITVFGFILSSIYMFPMMIIYHWNDTHRKCLPKLNLESKIYVFTQIYLFYILSPILMLVLGLLTIKNIHRQSRRTIRLLANARSTRRTERQLARMLLLQITIHLILVLPFGILYTLNTFIPSTRTSTIIAIRLACVTWQQSDYFIPFFIYILTGSVYRRELFRLLGIYNKINK